MHTRGRGFGWGGSRCSRCGYRSAWTCPSTCSTSMLTVLPWVTRQAELEALMDELESLHAHVPEPHPAQVWAEVTRVIGRDPRS